ncbi:MAG: Nif3-like dinuclear metal center hexameric protein [Gammaproteobacteria bacterium]|nr:Nif3-like dinuclear metal center hexameric protein [Gammaproteobacteria bacterium]MDH5799942.1 Nif3-like dinuclear metal center hexameric protein [Gammaproteobacteria bacterium]
MIDLYELLFYTDELLRIDQFKDYCPNGLQVEGKSSIQKLVTGVTANQTLIDVAADMEADAILVHHGMFWKGDNPCITGIKHRRLQRLLIEDISLIAYHLPLDAHPSMGNNTQLAEVLDLQIEGEYGHQGGPEIAMYGEVAAPLVPEAFAQHISERLGRMPLHIPGAATELESVAWCTGAAEHYVETAIQMGVDAFITGEASEKTVHLARESGIHFYAAGHHATERYGVQALGKHLADKFGLIHEFVDVDSPL